MKNLVVAVMMLILVGCMNGSRSADPTRSLEAAVQLVNSPGLQFRQVGMSTDAAGNGFAHEIIGELMSTNGSLLPLQLAENIADTIQAELRKQGWEITGKGRGGGIYYTSASQVTNANIQRASVDYSLHGAGGSVEVLVIERDYMPEPKTKVVGQLIVRLNQSK